VNSQHSERLPLSPATGDEKRLCAENCQTWEAASDVGSHGITVQ